MRPRDPFQEIARNGRKKQIRLPGEDSGDSTLLSVPVLTRNAMTKTSPGRQAESLLFD